MNTRMTYPRSPENKAIIVAMLAEGKTWEQIAKVIGCSRDTVQCMAREFRLTPEQMNRGAVSLRWTPAQDAILRELKEAGIAYRNISESIPGKSPHACERRAVLLGLKTAWPNLGEPGVRAQVSGTKAPFRPVVDGGGAGVLPAGHPMTWALLTDGTLLEGSPYQ